MTPGRIWTFLARALVPESASIFAFCSSIFFANVSSWVVQLALPFPAQASDRKQRKTQKPMSQNYYQLHWG
jgi:hypothetical protein